MKRLLVLLLFALPFACMAEEYQSTLLVQTGKLTESDLIVRTVTDLEDNKICLTFYVRTSGTSPVMSCYDSKAGFRSQVKQVGHFKKNKLIVRKIKDSVNDVSCLVAYVSSPGTSPAIECYHSTITAKDEIKRNGHLREGDLEIERVIDEESSKTCLIAYISVGSNTPTLLCYDGAIGGKGGMTQVGYMREGDLVVRKILDDANRKDCLITYVSTEGTLPNIYCYSEPAGGPPPAAAAAPKKEVAPATATNPGTWRPRPLGQ
ncbi:MAG: hypothetical protein PVJ66_06665 [Gammaproteobacteria bacterium]